MTSVITAESFVTAFARRAVRAGGPAWLRELRGTAIARFAERGLPSTRDEDWKYTSLGPLTATPFDLSPDGTRDTPSEDALAPFLVGDAFRTRLVFVDGRYVAKLSRVGPQAGGARIGSLAEAAIADEPIVRPQLEERAGESASPFEALNAAFWEDGAFVHVPAGVVLAEPVHLLFVATAPPGARADHPRSLVVLERGGRAMVLESYVALGGNAYLTNAVTDLILGAGATLDHVKAMRESPRGFHTGRTRVRQEGGSRARSCSLAFGGRLVRNDVDVRLDGEGAECMLSGLAVQGGQQHLDTHTLVDHRRPRALSRQLYKGVLDGRARGVFSGRVIVRRGADGTDAHQTNKNLLLADGVQVDSKPQLEIFAADVKCSHGAADGQLAEDAIFYLKSRGLDEAAARTLLTRAFAAEVLDRIPLEPVRAWCARLVAERLRDGRVIEETA
jgi:Fe-S cluster assembly protein SufD